MDAGQLLEELTNSDAHTHNHERTYYGVAGNRLRNATREVVINGDRFLVQVTVLSFRHEQPDT